MERPKHKFKNRWFEAFIYFISLVKVPSKETTEPAPIILYGAQWRFLIELDEAIHAGQHSMVVLKARQLGMTTIMLLMDIFWCYMHPGLQGAIIFDTGDNRETARDTITQMLDSLPKGFRIPIKKHNRSALIFGNGSRLQYMSAGKNANSGLGRSRGLAFVHASEISSWGDQKGIDSLKAGLSEKNPHRLYIWESTALGYNVFYDMHEEAKKDATQRAIFIGWWAKETYVIERHLRDYDGNLDESLPNPEFQRWWADAPRLSEIEEAMAILIKADYGHDMTPEQWAWWRKMQYLRSEQSLLEEFPWHEKVAFQVTGTPFFSLKRINEDMEFIRSGRVGFQGYVYKLGDSFLTMQCNQIQIGQEPELRIWEPPIRNAKYAIGVDVAYGRSDRADRHCVEVFRCFSDKMVQVAEWATNMPETKAVAWVLAHLAGSYRDCMINLEVSGPGLSVMSEIKYLRQSILMAHLKNLEPSFNAKDALDQARWFLYHRADTPGQGYMFNWKTNYDNKTEMYNSLRDSYNTEQVIIRGLPTLEEMITLVQNGTSIEARPGKKDDRPFATGLANYAWKTWIRFPLMQDNRTFEREMANQRMLTAQGDNVVTGIIPRFFAAKAAERSERDLQQLLERGY